MLLTLIFISFIGTNGPMLYFIYRHRQDRKTSVSHHMAISKNTHLTYSIGHFVGGLAFLYFAYKYFYLEKGSSQLLYLSFVGFIFEQIQAIFPNNFVHEKLHTRAAVAMGVLISCIVLISPFLLELMPIWYLSYLCLVLALFVAGVYALFNKHRFYRTQMLFFGSFHIFLFILLYGVK